MHKRHNTKKVFKFSGRSFPSFQKKISKLLGWRILSFQGEAYQASWKKALQAFRKKISKFGMGIQSKLPGDEASQTSNKKLFKSSEWRITSFLAEAQTAIYTGICWASWKRGKTRTFNILVENDLHWLRRRAISSTSCRRIPIFLFFFLLILMFSNNFFSLFNYLFSFFLILS